MCVHGFDKMQNIRIFEIQISKSGAADLPLGDFQLISVSRGEQALW